jgi:pleiotropic regulator 1
MSSSSALALSLLSTLDSSLSASLPRSFGYSTIGSSSSPGQSSLRQRVIQANEYNDTNQVNSFIASSAANDSNSLPSSSLALVPHSSSSLSSSSFVPTRWSLHRVLLGHSGWVRSVSVDPLNNEFISSASNDGTIKVWNLASGSLLATLTSSSGAIRTVISSARHPYLFSGGEDHLVKCWDLESNRVIRSYFGHASGVTALSLHPELDLLVSGSRDSTCKLWDMRINQAILTLTGHKDSVLSLQTQVNRPALISGSSDSTVRCWDLASGRCYLTLTQHQKGVRAVRLHSSSYSFATGGGEQIKIFQGPEAKFIRNLPGLSQLEGKNNQSQLSNAFVRVINSLDISEENLIAVGGESNAIRLFDWTTGSLSCEIMLQANIQGKSGMVKLAEDSNDLNCNSLTFDRSATRLIVGGNDKAVRVYKKIQTESSS